MGTAAAPPLWTAAFVRLTVMDLAYFLAAGVLLYALPLYAVGPVGSSEVGAGLAVGVYTVTAVVLRPWAGRLADNHGRRPLLLGGAVLAALCALSLVAAGSIGAVIGIRLAMGVAEAFFFVASFAALADLAPTGRTGEALSYNSLALYLGLALGPVLAATLIDSGGYVAAWVGAGVLCAAATALAALFRDTDEVAGARRRDADASDRGPERTPLIHRPTLRPALGFLGGMIAAAGFLAFAGIRGERLGMAAPSLVLFTYGGVVVLGRITFARLADRHNPLLLVVGALGIVTAGLATAAAAGSGATLLVAAAVTGIGITLLTPAFFASVFASTPAAERGAASGTATIFIDLGLGAGPVVLGAVATAADVPAAYLVGAGAALLGAAWTAGLVHRVGRIPATP